MLNVGLLGAGRIGQVHAKTIAEHAESCLSAVADVHAPSAEALGGLYGAGVQSVDGVIADPDIDAVLIATSTDTHCDLIEAAARAGKAILCEKPVDLSLDRATACLENVGEAADRVMMGFNRRFDANFRALKAALDAGEIGKSELLSVTSFDPAPPPLEYIAVSGGLFRDMTIHDFDVACWIMGALPETVTAKGSSVVDPAIGAAGDVDTAAIILTYADGRIAVIKNSRRAAYGYDQRIEILGSEGMLSADNMLESSVRKATGNGVQSAKPMYFFLERYAQAYVDEWDAFVGALREDAKVPVTLRDGVAALAIADAAARSAQTGQSITLAPI